MRAFFLCLTIIAANLSTCAWAQEPVLSVFPIKLGYGDGILIETPGLEYIPYGSNSREIIEQPKRSYILYDTGSKELAIELTGYLDGLFIDTIDVVIISHPHENHYGGLMPMMSKYKVKRVYINGASTEEKGYAELLRFLKDQGIPYSVLKKGDRLVFDQEAVALDVLHPESLSGPLNNDSLVIKVTYGDTACFLTGDIDEATQEQLLKEYPDLKNVDCVQVPHHGQNISESFIKTFQEKLFFVSTGPNPYGMPDENLVRRLKGDVYYTYRDSPFVFISDGKKFSLAP